MSPEQRASAAQLIAGHTVDKGKAEHNLELSDRRAKSVRRWLVEHGLADERLSAKGYGQVELKAGESKKAQRARNRRVEFRIIDPSQSAASTPAKP